MSLTITQIKTAFALFDIHKENLITCNDAVNCMMALGIQVPKLQILAMMKEKCIYKYTTENCVPTMNYAESLEETMGLKTAVIEQLYIVNKGNGYINLQDFIELCLHCAPEEGSENEMWYSYKLFDTEQKGRITLHDLRVAITGGASESKPVMDESIFHQIKPNDLSRKASKGSGILSAVKNNSNGSLVSLPEKQIKLILGCGQYPRKGLSFAEWKKFFLPFNLNESTFK